MPPQPAEQTGGAELLVGKVALFLWLADEVIRRNPQGNKPVIFLSDGNGRCMIVRASIYRKTRSVSWICFMSWNGCGRWLGVSLTSEPRSTRCISGWKSVSRGCWRGKWTR